MKNPKAAALGIFDGVHRGHLALVRKTVDIAGRKGLQPYVVTFHPHPANVLSNRGIPLILPLRRRVDILRQMGVEVFVQQFNKAFASLHAEEFFAMIRDGMGCAEIIVGRDFSCGRDMIMGERLCLVAMRKGVACTLVEIERDEHGEKISSQQIRESLSRGDLVRANALLGRPFSLYGKVKHGEKRGRVIGFPTLNLDCENEILPKEGVYAATVHFDDKARNGVLSIGKKPTFLDDGPIEVELHLFDFSGEIYGSELAVDVIEFLRDQRRFSGVNDLRAAIKRDIDDAKRILAQSRE